MPVLDASMQRLVRRALQEQPGRKDVASDLERARNAYSKGDLQDALEALDRALSVSANDPLLRLARGLTRLQIGQAAEALVDFDAALAGHLPPDLEADLHTSRALALHRLGRTVEALTELRLSLESMPDPDVLRLRRSLLQEHLLALADAGFGCWSGAKPPDRTHPIKLKPGPSIVDMVREGRR